MGCSASKPEEKAVTSTPYHHVWEVEEVSDIDGHPVKMSKFEHKVLLVVNIATNNSHCQAQLKELATLEKQLNSEGLQVLLFPCNDFGHQPEDAAAVKAACEAAGFQGHIMQFANVRGADEHPLFAFLRLTNPTCKLRVGTDLNKIVTNKKGTTFGTWGQGGEPHALEQYIKQALAGRPNMTSAGAKGGAGAHAVAVPLPAVTAH